MRRVLLLLLFGLALIACDESRSTSGVGQGSTSSSSTAVGGGGQGGSGAAGAMGGMGAAGGSGGAGGAGGSAGGAALRVLFIGNSYTGVNDLPALVRTIDAGGPAIATAAITPGGAQLVNHAANGAVITAIGQGWDAVVLQGQSVEPLLSPTQFFSGAISLDDAINPTGATTVMFETWARAPGHAVYQQIWSGGDPVAMQAGLRSAYQQAADSAGGVMAPVGDAWEQSLGQNSIVLHSGDGSHPSLAGSYLAAAVFYLVLTTQSGYVAPSPAPSPLSETDAATLRAVAAVIVGGN